MSSTPSCRPPPSLSHSLSLRDGPEGQMLNSETWSVRRRDRNCPPCARSHSWLTANSICLDLLLDESLALVILFALYTGMELLDDCPLAWDLAAA